MHAMLCVECCHTFPREDFCFLPWVGYRCNCCALAFLDFYARTSYSILDTVQTRIRHQVKPKKD